MRRPVPRIKVRRLENLAMHLEQYRWEDHLIRSGWWIAELGMIMFALAALAAASPIERPLTAALLARSQPRHLQARFLHDHRTVLERKVTCGVYEQQIGSS